MFKVRMACVVLLGVFSMMVSETYLDVPCYDQTVNYKTSCESMATVEVLNYLGYDITIDDFLGKYLDIVERADVVESDGNIFDQYFVGDPHTYDGLLCNPPVIVEAVTEYFGDIGETNRLAIDRSGLCFNFLLDEVAIGRPVVLWITHGCVNSEVKEFVGNQFFAHSHTVVLSGFDRARGVVQLTDSVDGIVELPYEQVRDNYEFCGKRCVVIK